MADVLRLVGGEDLDLLSREFRVEAEILSDFRSKLLEGGFEPIDFVVTEDRKRIHDLLSHELKVAPTTGFDCCDLGVCDGPVRRLSSGGRKGDWAYVGAHYGEAIVGGKKAKVLFVSKDRPYKGGMPDWPFEFSQSKQDFRGNATPDGNPHMKGVYFEMKHLRGDGVDNENISLQFALVNAVLCGPVGAKGKSGGYLMASQSTGTMQNNCRKNTVRIIQTLNPDVVVVHGPKAERGGLRRRFCLKTIKDWGGRHPEFCSGSVDGKRILFLLKRHPSRYNGYRKWGKIGFGPPELLDALTRLRKCYAGSTTPA